jgi:PAS domain S-box-containing protein
LHRLAEQSRTFAWEVDQNGLYTYVNDTVRVVLGYEPADIIGQMHFYDLHPEEGREAFKAAAQEAFSSKQAFKDLPNAVVSKQGEI